ncbi:MAG: HlyD family efflux transporter periplasmic adaptor subunit [Candidatus Paceibacterota bacterium]
MLKRLYEMYGKKKVITTVVIVVLIVVYGLNSGEDAVLDEGSSERVSEVVVATPATLENGNAVSLIGTVRPQSEVKITNERGGKVTSVQTALGSTVKAGQILLTLENDSERASLLQAEGAYEAALANSDSSDSGLREAESRYTAATQGAVSSIDSAYITFTDSLYNTVDKFFSNPTSGIIGFKLNGKGQTSFLNEERTAMRTIVSTWPRNIAPNSEQSKIMSALDVSKQNNERLLSLVDTIVLLLQESENASGVPGESVSALSADLTSVRNRLVGAINAIDGASANLAGASESLKRASIGAKGGTTSLSDAQIKQALGSLRAAQANYEKTLIRTPLSGTVNSFDVKVGAYLNAFSDIATIANNNALEVVVFASDKERGRLAVGDEVVLATGKTTGTIVSIAPAIDSVTQKTEVRISVQGDILKSGETIRVEKVSEVVTTDNVIRLPLTAVKFTSTSGSIFVVENEKLVARSVELGEVIGSTVEVMAGLDINTEFVLDARGHNAGEKVTTVTK